MVHAYDLNMQMPETPMTPEATSVNRVLPTSGASSRKQSPARELSSWPSPMSRKRERTEEPDFHPGPPLKRMFTMSEAEILRIYCSEESSLESVGGRTFTMTEKTASVIAPSEPDFESEKEASNNHSPITSPAMLSPTHRRVVTRDFMRSLLHEALRSSHPTSELHKETALCETVEVRSIGSSGEVQDKTVHLEIESDVPEIMITEEQQLQFALQKIVDNAIKFTDIGSITITIKMGRNSQVIEIWVVDTGCGIAEESKSNLFKPHFQEDSSTSRSRDGLGLSLFNAKAHVRKNLGGDVTLERSATEGPSKGSEFLIRLPISVLEAESVAPLVGTPPPAIHPICRACPCNDTKPFLNSSKPTSPELAAKSPTHAPTPQIRIQKEPSCKRIAFNPNLAKDYPLNILIAEDNAINRNVAIGSLNKLGYSNDNITLAYDGVEAVRQYEASLSKPPEQRFNAILMDIWMPNMDGYGATLKIMDLSVEHGQSTTIVAVTADITAECLDRAKAAGMQGFLAKPYKVLDMERLIMEHFQKL